jgi:hypothetical protein
MTTSSSSPANDSSEGLSGSPPAHTGAERLSGRAWGMLVVLSGALFLGGFDVFGAVAVTAAMLLLVFTVVEAPDVGWGAPRTLASLAGVGALLAAFVAIERRAAAPLVHALLDGFHAATVVSLLAGLLGAAATAVSIRARGGPAAEPAYADQGGRR